MAKEEVGRPQVATTAAVDASSNTPTEDGRVEALKHRHGLPRPHAERLGR
jgi:hypothetical protein